MKAKKALKKLKKKSVKAIKSRALEQLQLLKSSDTSKRANSVDNKVGWSSELKNVANDAAISALSELAAPLSPVLSWFNDGGRGIGLQLLNLPRTRVWMLGKVSRQQLAPLHHSL